MVSLFSSDIDDDIYTGLSDNDRKFMGRVYSNGLSKYISRIESIGFKGMSRVLDAGCGFGQWSFALAELNVSVSAIDFSKERVGVVEKLAKQKKVNNLSFVSGSILELPYEDGCFDAVFCYSVIFNTSYPEALKEFFRVLKPGGRLYLNANAVGWYLYLWADSPNKAVDYDPQQVAASAFSDTLSYKSTGKFSAGMNLIIERAEMIDALNLAGFSVLAMDREGGVSLLPKKSMPFLLGDYKGIDAVYEVLCVVNK